MLDDFTMTIYAEDFLRIVNAGIRELTGGLFCKFIEPGDTVVKVEHQKISGRYTLVFASGRRIKVAEKQVKG